MRGEDTIEVTGELEREIGSGTSADSVDDTHATDDAVQDGGEEWVQEHVEEIGTIAAALEDKLTLREMIESDTEVDRKTRKYRRAHGALFAGHIAFLVEDVVTGNLLNADPTDAMEFVMMGGWISAKGAKYLQEGQDVFTDGPVGEYTVLPRGSRDVVSELLDGSAAVLYEEDGYQGEMPGGEAVGHYEEAVEMVEAGYDDLVDDFDDLGSDEAEAFMERQFGEEMLGEIKEHSLLPVVRFVPVGSPGDMDYVFQIEVYAGDECRMVYQGITSGEMKWRVEDSGYSLRKIRDGYAAVADRMDWEGLKPGADRMDDDTLSGYLYDTATGVRDAAYWAGGKVREKLR